MKIHLSITAVALATWFVAGARAAETGNTRADSELMAAPYRDAKSAGKLARNTRVDVLERRGAWLHVKTVDKDGWLRLYEVRLGDGSEQKGNSGLSALWNVSTTGRSGTQGIVATTGVRGMSADQLKGAQPNAKEFKKLDRYRADDAQARDLAKTGGLNEKDVAFLPKPE